MKTLNQRIEESQKTSIKEVSKEKLVDEDSASFMRASPKKEGGIMKGTLKDDKKNDNY
jgi:hypothetical protein